MSVEHAKLATNRAHRRLAWHGSSVDGHGACRLNVEFINCIISNSPHVLRVRIGWSGSTFVCGIARLGVASTPIEHVSTCLSSELPSDVSIHREFERPSSL